MYYFDNGEFQFRSEVLNLEQIKECFEVLKNMDPSNPPTTLEIVRKITGDPNMDTRNKEGREVKRLFETYGSNLDKSYVYKKNVYILTAEEKKSINANLSRFNRMIDLARFVFDNPDLSNLSKEFRAMQDYIEKHFSINARGSINLFSEEAIDEVYRPPTTPLATLREAKKYVKGLAISEERFQDSKYYNWMNKLKEYLQDNHFIYYINNNIKTAQKRELFLSAFIKYTYNKPDLSEEEKEQYIALCAELVLINDMFEKIETINEKIDGVLIDEDKDSVSTSLLKQREGLQKSLDEAKRRKNDLIKSLDGTRADRKKARKESSTSFIELINFWREEEGRQRVIKVAEARKEQLKETIKDLSDCDTLIAEIWGSGSEDDILYG